MPLSEEEQRILQEMEQNLRQHDRDFAQRVSRGSLRVHTPSGTRWAVAGFLAGFGLLLGTFRFSVALGALGFFMMLGSALLFTHEARNGASNGSQRVRRAPLGGELSHMGRRIRSRFGHRS